MLIVSNCKTFSGTVRLFHTFKECAIRFCGPDFGVINRAPLVEAFDACR